MKAKGLIPNRQTEVLLCYLCSSLFLGTFRTEVKVVQQQCPQHFSNSHQKNCLILRILTGSGFCLCQQWYLQRICNTWCQFTLNVLKLFLHPSCLIQPPNS